MTWTVLEGDCLETMRGLADCSVDAVVTDPPYGLSREPDAREVLTRWLAGEDYEHRGSGFMGKTWDSFVPGPAVWREVLRVLKPGGHALVFAGTRTVDLMGMALRLAGFEIRDNLLAWCYGSGFPKSLDVSKALDAAAGAEREVVGSYYRHGGGIRTRVPDSHPAAHNLCRLGTASELPLTAPATDLARQWQGWGTALKPAWEPVLLCRRPLDGTVAGNVAKWGTGGINVDGCRVGHSEPAKAAHRTSDKFSGKYNNGEAGHYRQGEELASASPAGRFPPNLLLSHSPLCERVGAEDYRCAPGCAVAALDAQAGERKSGTRAEGVRTGLGYHSSAHGDGGPALASSSGPASRFFPRFAFDADDFFPALYCPKASRAEREAGCEHLPPRTGAEAVDRVPDSAGLQNPRAGAGRTAALVRNHHPTVKPRALCQWLTRLITPPGGTVLDPFAGSGSIGVGALLEGFSFIGCELTPDYLPILRARLEWAERQARGEQLSLFAEPSHAR